MDTSKLIAELEFNSEKPDVLVWIDGDLHDFEIDDCVGGQIHLNVEMKEPKEPETELTIVLGNEMVTKFKADLTEEQIMTIFNISSKKETYIDAKGFLEFHCEKRGMMIYSNIKA
jgi:hypothetical protein